jgi:hypothetical protein
VKGGGVMPDEIQCSPNHPCTAVQLLTQRVEDHEKGLEKVNELIEKLQNRLPLWATMAFTACGAVIGILAGHVSF